MKSAIKNILPECKITDEQFIQGKFYEWNKQETISPYLNSTVLLNQQLQSTLSTNKDENCKIIDISKAAYRKYESPLSSKHRGQNITTDITVAIPNNLQMKETPELVNQQQKSYIISYFFNYYDSSFDIYCILMNRIVSKSLEPDSLMTL